MPRYAHRPDGTTLVVPDEVIVAVVQALSDQSDADQQTTEAKFRLEAVDTEIRALAQTLDKLVQRGDLDEVEAAQVDLSDMHLRRQVLRASLDEAAGSGRAATQRLADLLQEHDLSSIPIEELIDIIDQETPDPAAEALPRALSEHPPAHLIEADDLALIAADIEPLLTAAERFVADESNSETVRQAVAVRRQTLLGELALFDEGGDSTTVVRAIGYLISTVGTSPSAWAPLVGLDDVDVPALQLQTEHLAAASIELAEDATAVDAALVIADSVDKIANEITEPDTAIDALRRGRNQWLENDLWTKHVNHAVSAAGTAVVGLVAARTGIAGAVYRAGVALIRARFPWLFS